MYIKRSFILNIPMICIYRLFIKEFIVIPKLLLLIATNIYTPLSRSSWSMKTMAAS